MVTNEAARVAATLTKAQRTEIMRDALSGDSIVVARNMLKKRLFKVVPDSSDGKWGPALITPLGLAVRAHLENRND